MLWLEAFTWAVLGYTLFVSAFVQAEEDFSNRVRRQNSGSSQIWYECLTANNIPGKCVHYSQCPEHSTKSTEQLRSHRCALYRRDSRPPIVCCANPQTAGASQPSSVTTQQPVSDDGKTPQTVNSDVRMSRPVSDDVTRPQPVGNNLLNPQPVKSDVRMPQSSYNTRMPQPDGDDMMPQPDSDDLLNHPNARLLPIDECGRHPNSSMSTGRSYAGNVSQLGEFPWTVLLKYSIGSQHKFLCGGVLIGDRYVLTAAHCVTPDAPQLTAVRVGEHDQTTNPDCGDAEDATERNCAPPVRDIPVSNIVTPAEYDKANRNHYYDIAVVILKTPIVFNDHVQPLCLPFGEIGRRDLTHRRLWIAGWGTKKVREGEEKRKGHIRVWNHADCALAYQGGRIAISRDKQICVGERGNDSCKSDSGGPLMGFRGTPRGDIWYLYGVASFGPTPCDTPGMPEVYTRVSYYLNWIVATLSTV